jgi:3-oxoacyl-[acyl-carrier-protein] synthase-3
MKPAVATLGKYAATIDYSDPKMKLWSNNGGREISSGAEFVELMVQQVSSPVRWDLCMQSMVEAGVTAVIELAPAGTLVGLAKRAMPGIETLAVKTPENLDAALSLFDGKFIRIRRRGKMSQPVLKQYETVKFSRIYSLGASRGDLTVTNDDIAGPIDSSDEWIRQRTGIITRRRASKDVSLMDMAVEASNEAIKKAGISPSEIGAVIFSTITHPFQTPSAATLLAEKVGANPAPAYDISAACAGYCYGIAQADALVRSGVAKYVLVVGGEKLSDFIDPTDRTISFLLGDGAGAAIVGPSETPGISPSVWGSDGSEWDAVGMDASLLDFRDGEHKWPTLRQEGLKVFKWAVWEMVKVAREALEVAGITADDLSALVTHQANIRIIDELAKQLEVPEHVVIARDIVTTGNTSAASIPLAMHALLASGEVKSGGLALEIGFGAGLAFGAQVVVLP